VLRERSDKKRVSTAVEGEGRLPRRKVRCATQEKKEGKKLTQRARREGREGANLLARLSPFDTARCLPGLTSLTNGGAIIISHSPHATVGVIKIQQPVRRRLPISDASRSQVIVLFA
jgi:hypothetical protein